MGRLASEDGKVAYRQENGEITAWLPDREEKMELTHVGTPLFKKIFYLLVFLGVVYLSFIFIFY